MFVITAGKGFHMTFKNGYTLSVQWGPGNYCENQADPWDAARNASAKGMEYESPSAEVAVWLTDGGKWVTPDFFPEAEFPDVVVGRLTADEVASLIARITAKA